MIKYVYTLRHVHRIITNIHSARLRLRTGTRTISAAAKRHCHTTTTAQDRPMLHLTDSKLSAHLVTQPMLPHGSVITLMPQSMLHPQEGVVRHRPPIAREITWRRLILVTSTVSRPALNLLSQIWTPNSPVMGVSPLNSSTRGIKVTSRRL